MKCSHLQLIVHIIPFLFIFLLFDHKMRSPCVFVSTGGTRQLQVSLQVPVV